MTTIDATKKRFLECFPANQRGTVMNRFLAPVRNGILEPDGVVEAVLRDCYERAERAEYWGDDDARDKSNLIIELMTVGGHAGDAYDLAEYCIAYEALPAAERQRLKEDSRRAGFNLVAQSKPVSEKQAALIRKLGSDPATVANMRDASDLIDRLLKGQQ